MRDCDWARTLGLTQLKWAQWKRRLLKPPGKSKRQIRKEKVMSTQKFVTDRGRLFEQVGLSLRQRAAFLNIKHLPTKLYNNWNLGRLYQKAGVKFKNVRLRNAPSVTSRAFINRPADLTRLKKHVQSVLARDLELIVLDECCFTWRGYSRKEWAHKGENLELYKCAGQKAHQCVACCGAISLARGKELMVFRARSFNGEQFLDYLK